MTSKIIKRIKYSINLPLYYLYSIVKQRRDFPNILNIELTNYCNLKCITCPHEKMQRSKGYMDFKLFKKIINEVKEHPIHELRLHHFGDPLLHQQLVKFIRYIKKNDTNNLIKNVSFSTNCTALTHRKSMEIIKSGLDTIRLSLDGINKETYEAIRVNADYDNVINNITNFFKLRKQINSKKPKVELQIINMKNTKNQIEEFKNRWNPFLEKGDMIHVQNFINFAGDVEKDLAVKKKEWVKHFPCLRLWNSLVICWDGTVVPCCYDSDCKIRLGNLSKDNSISEIWKSKLFKQIREIHLKGESDKLSLCKNCDRNTL